MMSKYKRLFLKYTDTLNNTIITYYRNVVEYWHLICTDSDLTGILLDNFLQILSSSCLYEPNEPCVDRQKIAIVQPFAIFCALHKMMPCKDIKEVSKQNLQL